MKPRLHLEIISFSKYFLIQYTHERELLLLLMKEYHGAIAYRSEAKSPLSGGGRCEAETW